MPFEVGESSPSSWFEVENVEIQLSIVSVPYASGLSSCDGTDK